MRKRSLERKSLPVLLSVLRSGQSLVHSCSEEGRALGIRSGMSTKLAQAICPEIQVVPLHVERSFELLSRIACWAQRYTPQVALDYELFRAKKEKGLERVSPRSFGIVLDMSGMERTYKGKGYGEEEIVEKLRRELLQALPKSNPILTFAPTIGSGWALTRFGKPLQTQRKQFDTKEEIRNFFRDFPLEALRIPEVRVGELKELGIDTLGSLFHLPQKQILERFGPEILLRIEHLYGERAEYIRYLDHEKEIVVSRDYDFPIRKQKALTQALLTLLHKLHHELEYARKELLHLSLALETRRENYKPKTVRHTLRFSAGTRNLKHIQTIVESFVERSSFPEGVWGITLRAEHSRTRRKEQRSLNNRKKVASLLEREERCFELLDHFLNRIGSKKVCRIGLSNSHLPEQSYQFYPVEEVPKDQCRTLLPYRPSLLFRPPKEIEAIALLPDHPPAWIQYQRERLSIISGYGPERIAEPWWQDDIYFSEEGSSVREPRKVYGQKSSARDYFTVQDFKGRWLWVFREKESQRWFLHGTWG